VISSQSFALGVRILELAAWTDDPLVVEVHPEVSFRELAGADLGDKKTWNGLMARRQALATSGIEIPERLPEAPGVPADDVLDAAVAAWSAERYASGRAHPLPSGHARGVPGAIWR
jgi:predicted RNase H-like nuclease